MSGSNREHVAKSMIYAHILSSVVLSFPPDTTDDPHRDTSEFNKLLSRRTSWGKKIFSILYILKAHMVLQYLAECSHWFKYT